MRSRWRARSAAICVIRNAADLVPVLCGHYLHAGFNRLEFLDDGSTDGTGEILHRIAAATQKVIVRNNPLGVFDQRALINEMANRLIGDGYRIIFPFDCDEFWLVDVATLAKAIGPWSSDLVIRGKWANFVQMREHRVSTPAALADIRYRVAAEDTADMEDVINWRRGFVSSQQSKSAVFSRSSVAFSKGQHVLDEGPEAVHAEQFPILHVPLRSAGEILLRGQDHEPRRAMVRSSFIESWQSRFFAEALQDGKADAVWRANSADEHGQLDLPGGHVALVPDDRFRQTVAAALQHLEAVTGLRFD